MLLAILGMAISTYILRAGGYALLRAFRPSPFVTSMLSHMPGCIFVAFVVPALWIGGPHQVLAAAAVTGVMIASRSFLLAIASGVAVIWLMRQI